MKNLATGRCFRTRTKGQGRKSVTPPRLAIDATVEEKSSAAGRLFVGFYEGKKLKFAGRLGTGFSEKLLSTLFSKQYRVAIAPQGCDSNPSVNGAYFGVE